MKKYLLWVLSFLVLCVATAQFYAYFNTTSRKLAFAQIVENSTNEGKVFSNVTIDDDFADDKVLILIKQQESLSFKTHSRQSFSEISVSSVRHANSYAESIARVQGTSDYRKMLVLKLQNPGKNNVLAAIKRLEKRSDIYYVGPSYIETIDSAPTDKKYTDRTQWGLNKISAPEAWNVTTGNATNKIRVGIIDTGIDASHPDLKNQVNKSMSRDFTIPYPHIPDAVIDKQGHGTHIAGIIGAEWNNGGIAGVNQHIELISLRAGVGRYLDWENSANAVIYAIEKNIQILNFSASGKFDDPYFKEAIRRYTGLFVCCSGNENNNNDKEPRYPSNYDFPNHISVGASDKNDERSNWIPPFWRWLMNNSASNGGATSVDLYAPGTGIYSTVPGNKYQNMDGTSQAAPHVAGVAALIISKYPNLAQYPALVKEAIMNGVDKIPALNGLCVSGGRLNAYKALQAAAVLITANPIPYLINHQGNGLTVSGDFDGDGLDDVAMFVATSTHTQLHVWKSNGNGFDYAGVWWSTAIANFNTISIKGRMVAGDFNGDSKCDVAVLYNMGNNRTKIFVYVSNGTKFTEVSYWDSGVGNYPASNITNRVVAGDFNGDGKCDIAALFDYGSGTSAMHVWLSNGTRFWDQGINGWWSERNPGWYNANNVTGRVVAGDFNGDGKCDIAAFFDYGNNRTRIFRFMSTGSSFSQLPCWDSGYGNFSAGSMTGCVVSGKFNNDNYFDVATFYNYNEGYTELCAWHSTSSGTLIPKHVVW